MTITNELKENIIALRVLNYSYACIGEKLNVSPNTVKSVCRRSGIEPETPNRKTKSEKAQLELCKYCGRQLVQTSGQHKTFCNDTCRMEYWKAKRRKN